MPESKVKEWKKKEVDYFAQLIDDYKIVGVVNLQNIPARQLQNMRGKLRDKVYLRMTKKTIMTRAFEKSDKDNIKALEEHLKGMPALLFTEENPFALYSLLKKEKSSAPIKAGQVAPNDIVVEAGPTDFPPGPIIGELSSFGIPASVDAGKVAIDEDTTVAEAGEEVSGELAGILGRLGIEPMEIGLNLVAVHEDGEVLTDNVLDIDEEEYRKSFQQAAKEALNLSVNAGYPTNDSIELMITKSHQDAYKLALSEDILTDETTEKVLAKAENQAKSVDSEVDWDKQPEPEESEESSDEKEDGKDSEDSDKEESKEKSEEKGDDSDKDEDKSEDKESDEGSDEEAKDDSKEYQKSSEESEGEQPDEEEGREEDSSQEDEGDGEDNSESGDDDSDEESDSKDKSKKESDS